MHGRRLAINALTARPGGGATVVEAICVSLQSLGYEVVVLTAAEDTQKQLDDRVGVLAGVAIVRVLSGAGSFAGAKKYFFQKYLLSRWLKKREIPLILSLNGFACSGICNVVYHVNLLRFLPSTTSTGLERVKDYFRNYDSKKALSAAGLNLFESEYILALAKKSVVEIRNPQVAYVGLPDYELKVAAKSKHHLGSESYRLLTVTSSQPHKDNATLVRALYSLVKLKPDEPWELVIAGGHNSADWLELEALIAELGLGGRVVWAGFLERHQLRELYLNSLCLVSASKVESFCMVALEAMAFGCPAIVTNSTSMPESVGSAGIVVEPGDVSGFVRSVVELKTGGRWVEISSESKIWAHGFSWKHFGKELDGFLSEKCMAQC